MDGNPRASGRAGRFELRPEQLRWRCDPAVFPFQTTDELAGQPRIIIGQPRAVEAIKLGLELHGPGYNVFVAGEVGTGRSTTVRRQLAALPRGGPPEDLLFVHNFRDPDQPRLVALPAGRGIAFRDAMDELTQLLRKSLSELFDSDEYRQQAEAAADAARAQHKERARQLEKQIQEEGFSLVQVQMGQSARLELMRLVDGEPVDLEALEAQVQQGQLSREELDRIREAHARLGAQMEEMGRELAKLQRELRRQAVQLDRDLARSRVQDSVAELRLEFPFQKIAAYLDEAVADILDHLERFREPHEPPATGAELEMARALQHEQLLPYSVNVVVDNSRTGGRPILWETSPTYRNLFGTIERVQDVSGSTHTDHMHIKSGSLLQANGGFLVLDAMDVVAEAGVWPALKRCLRTGVVEIRAFDPLNVSSAVSLKPQAVPVDVKVVLIGTPSIYSALYTHDEDFKKIFKVKASFAVHTRRGPEELQRYASLVHGYCVREQLLPFRREAVAAVVEHAVRLAEHQDKLSTRFNQIADLVRESSYWAQQEGAIQVGEQHVDRALDRQLHRLDLVQELLRERIAQGSVLIDVAGAKVGQVNGLVVLDAGDHSFGLPSRITATTAVGRAGIVNVERESEMSGSIHTKGLLILAGFLRARFAQDQPLALSASLCFEQGYVAVEGDSASCAELYALLSSLSGVPLRQSLAVTGSVNQKGEVQPIGGIHEKIEGYFDLCRLVGLDGQQGVLIPAPNVQNLQLRKDLVEAVREGRFHVHAVSSVEEGVEVLTGLEAGARDADGAYPPGSVFGRALAELRRLARQVREHGAADLQLEI